MRSCCRRPGGRASPNATAGLTAAEYLAWDTRPAGAGRHDRHDRLLRGAAGDLRRPPGTAGRRGCPSDMYSDVASLFERAAGSVTRPAEAPAASRTTTRLSRDDPRRTTCQQHSSERARYAGSASPISPSSSCISARITVGRNVSPRGTTTTQPIRATRPKRPETAEAQGQLSSGGHWRVPMRAPATGSLSPPTSAAPTCSTRPCPVVSNPARINPGPMRSGWASGRACAGHGRGWATDPGWTGAVILLHIALICK